MKYPNPLFNNDWDTILGDEIKKIEFSRLMGFIDVERKKTPVLPPEGEVFTALRYSSFYNTKVVIIGQDPYHTKGLAHGLAFSVNKNNTIPPSLRNILKELQSDLHIPITKKGNLKNWANQGVLLLNTILTVREKEAGSHQNIGWEDFTDTIISKLSSGKNGLIFLLWGAYANKKSLLINKKKHYILKTTHPSPFSAYKGFLGCKHFSKTNNILIQNNHTPINWSIE